MLSDVNISINITFLLIFAGLSYVFAYLNAVLQPCGKCQRDAFNRWWRRVESLVKMQHIRKK